MQNNVDFSRFRILDEEVLKKTRGLGKHYVYCQMNRQKVELSLFYLWKLVPERDDEMLDRIAQVFSEVEKRQNAQLIWARLCVAARFFYHDDSTWQNILFPKLEERILLPDLAADVQTAGGLLDAYFAERDALKGTAAAAASVPKQPAAPTSSSKPKPEEVFHILYQKTDDYLHLLTFLNQDKTACSDADWARHALAIYRHPKTLIDRPATFKKWLSVFCDLFDRQVAYRDPNKLDRTKSQKQIEPFLP